MDTNNNENLETALLQLMADRTDPDRLMFDQQLNTIRKVYASGVYVSHIWDVLRKAGFKGGKEKLVKFMSEAGIKKGRYAHRAAMAANDVGQDAGEANYGTV